MKETRKTYNGKEWVVGSFRGSPYCAVFVYFNHSVRPEPEDGSDPSKSFHYHKW